MSGFSKPSCRVKVNADGDWQILPPAGQITKIGDAVGAFVPPITNDDLLVTGRLGSMGQISGGDGIATGGDSETGGAVIMAMIDVVHGWGSELRILSEELTIPVGQGAAGVEAGWMAQPNSIIVAIVARVTQAPGGGATWFSVYRMDTSADKLIDFADTTVDGTYDSTIDSDGTHDGPFYNPIMQRLTVITNSNVTGSDMKVRLGISYIELWNFDD